MLRTTYLSSEDPLKYVKVENDGSLIFENFPAAKHLRYRVNSDDSSKKLQGQTVSFEYSKTNSLLDLPFDPPSGGIGGRVYASQDANWDAVQEFMHHVANINLEDPIEMDDWQFVTSLDKPLFSIPELQNADAVRIYFNSETNEVVSEAWFGDQVWTTTEEILPQFKQEVGLFHVTKNPNGVYKLTGRVRVLGVDEESKPVMMHWYPKHISGNFGTAFNGTISAHLVKPYGLHPTLEYELTGSRPDLEVCSLYTLLELPNDVFVDQYELEDAPESGELIAVWGNTDLERAQWDHTQISTALFKLPGEPGTFKIPMHFRYVLPHDQPWREGTLPYPRVFYMCRNDIAPERDSSHIDPFERLGVESFFPLENSVFYQFYPGENGEVPYRVPSITAQYESAVGKMTVAVVTIQALFFLIVILYHKLWPGKTGSKKKVD